MLHREEPWANLFKKSTVRFCLVFVEEAARNLFAILALVTEPVEDIGRVFSRLILELVVVVEGFEGGLAVGGHHSAGVGCP